MTRSADGDLPIDSVLRDTYKIVSVLGRGGMGSVFLAQHLRLPGKQVAVKVLRSNERVAPDLHARFRREAEIASRLGHPNIVEVLDFDTLEDGSPFLVLEYLRGESLADRLARGRPSREEVFSFVRQMGSALQTAHRAGIVHRDLKPANVFLVPTDSGGVVGERVKLLDFGISKVLTSDSLHTQEAVLIGTPQYMAPEQAQGRNSEVDVRTDVFALGCIVFEMLAGTTPFGTGSMVELVYRIVHEPPLPLAALAPGLPAQVVSAVERALAKRPDARYPDVASFIADLTGSPLHSLPLLDRDGSRSGPSGIALPTDGPPSLSSTMAPGGTARFGASAGLSDTMGFGATLAPSQPAPPRPSDTARFGASAGLSGAMDPGATLAPSQPAPLAAPQPAPAVVAPSSAAQRPSRGPVVVLLLAGVVALGWWLRPVPPTTPPAPAPSAVATPPPAEAPAVVVTPPPAEAPAVVTPPAAVAVSPAVPAPQVQPVANRPARPAVAETVPEAVRETLREGEAALEGGNPDEALRLGRLSQRTKPTAAAQSLLTRAYCQKKDLGGALGAVKGVASAELSKVKRYCQRYEIEF